MSEYRPESRGDNPKFESLDTEELFDTYHYADPADGTEGIQNIIDSHGASTLILLDSATYEGGQIDLEDNDAIGIVGTSRYFAGDNGTRIKLADNEDTDLVLGNNASSCYFENIRFDGNKANNTGGDAFHAKTMFNSIWYSCEFRNASRHGLFLDGGGDGNADDHGTIYCRANQNNNDGFRIGTPASRHYYLNTGNNDRGIFVVNGRTSIQVNGAQIYGNTTAGLKIGNAERIVMNNIHIEGPNTSNTGLSLESAHRNMTLANIYLVNSFGDAVSMRNYAGSSINTVLENVNVIQGISPSGTQGSGSIDVGFAIDDPQGNGYEDVSLVNCSASVQGDGFGTTAWQIGGGLTDGVRFENCYNLSKSDIAGTLTLDGRGVNDGDPSSSGAWNGKASLAGDNNVFVEDTANNNLYTAVGSTFLRLNN